MASEPTEVHWRPPAGYAMVMDVMLGGFSAGFDSDREYRFLRYGQTQPAVYRLADNGPAFNIAGLYYATLDATRPPS